MQELSKSQRARIAIRTFKVLADALTIRGYYKAYGKTGLKLAEALKLFSPEIYGSMSDSRIVELKGLEYVIDRLPRGIEKCTRIILTAQEDFKDTSFEQVIPPKRRRVCYAVSEKEICFAITRGLTEIYDILTHITFLNIESRKIFERMGERGEGDSLEWQDLEEVIARGPDTLQGAALDQAIWNLSIILGRTYRETRETYEYLEKNKRNGNHNGGLFQIIYSLGRRYANEMSAEEEQLAVYFTPSLHEMIGHHRYAEEWSANIKQKLCELSLEDRPIHLISANMHSVKNLFYGLAAAGGGSRSAVPAGNLYEMIRGLRNRGENIDGYAEKHGYTFLKDLSGSNIDVNIFDTSRIDPDGLHPDILLDREYIRSHRPVIVVMDYAFGTQAFQVIDELLSPVRIGGKSLTLDLQSISIMGKAGILPGNKGDIMLATAHVMEGTPHNYIVDNDLTVADFDTEATVYCGPMVTVLGTSLQNRDVLKRFQHSSWRAVGLEMEGAHYQRAINAARIRGHIGDTMKIRYAYYASDNPLKSGQTLASESMGDEGIVPTYMITKVLLNKILQPQAEGG